MRFILFIALLMGAAAAALPPPVQLTAEQDRQRTMDQLQITALRPGANNHPNLPNTVNYDESKANPYPNLPDPLTLNNGKKVTSAKTWWKVRRPQIVEFFDQDVYGRVPANVPAVRWGVVSTSQEKVGDVAVITKHIVGHVDNSSYPAITVEIPLTLTTPANASGPVPVIMQFTYDPKVMAALRARMAAAGPLPAPFPGPTWQEQVLALGWGYASLIPTNVQADNGAGLTAGIIGLVNKGQPRKPDDWGALRAWAWGASRALDYLETDKAVDAKKVGLEGHSRYGKATLVAMAYDQRLAIAYVSSSGAGGAALYRRNWGERLENVAATNEYHWMAGNFLKYAGPLHAYDMPVDAHELIALCAPRPVFIGAGSSPAANWTDAAGTLDGWVDPKGMFMAAVAAGPVYELLGKKDLGTSAFPPMDTSLIDGDLAYREHHYGHTDAPNWPTFLTFAGRFFSGPSLAATAAKR